MSKSNFKHIMVNLLVVVSRVECHLSILNFRVSYLLLTGTNCHVGDRRRRTDEFKRSRDEWGRGWRS